MPKLKNRPPKYAQFKQYAVIYHQKKRIYLGLFGSEESKIAYARFIAESRANPIFYLPKDEPNVTVKELAAAFLEFAKETYDYSNYTHYKIVTIDFLLKLYGDIPVDDFKPGCLKTIRSEMIQSKRYCRPTINDHIGRLVRIFGWGVEEEYAQPNTVAALREVKALRKGDPGTFDHPPRKEVPDDVIKRTLPFMSLTVAAMVQVQRLTGMRPSELCSMTVGDIDKNREPGLWHYIPGKQKTEEYIGAAPIPLGKPEQELIAPYLENKTEKAAVFSPRTAIKEIRERQRAVRKSKVTPSQMERDRQRAEHPADNVGEFYDRNSYRQAVGHAITQANKAGQNIPKWSPYQLRHAQATDLEKNEGLDVAQAVLRHTTANTTKRYAHGQLAIAEEVARNRVNPFEEPATGAEPTERKTS